MSPLCCQEGSRRVVQRRGGRTAPSHRCFRRHETPQRLWLPKNGGGCWGWVSAATAAGRFELLRCLCRRRIQLSHQKTPAVAVVGVFHLPLPLEVADGAAARLIWSCGCFVSSFELRRKGLCEAFGLWNCVLR
ncbi:uncharacterized protein DS421_20g696430 [Arachis hypogaea]|nr:uncharacterized protein DS421_20g696430 [Arachis hypogaea]